MIELYSGTPGSGKSLDAVRKIWEWIKMGRMVISNYPVRAESKRTEKLHSKNFIFVNTEDMKVNYFIHHALQYHERGKERQTLIVFDEAQELFNPRDFARKDRKEYLNFFSLHRHIGFDVLIITQNDRLLDRQLRALLEYEVKHRKINNFSKGLLQIFPIKFFMRVTVWYGVKEKIGAEIFVYKKKLGQAYDSYKLFDSIEDKYSRYAETGD